MSMSHVHVSPMYLLLSPFITHHLTALQVPGEGGGEGGTYFLFYKASLAREPTSDEQSMQVSACKQSPPASPSLHLPMYLTFPSIFNPCVSHFPPPCISHSLPLSPTPRSARAAYACSPPLTSITGLLMRRYSLLMRREQDRSLPRHRWAPPHRREQHGRSLPRHQAPSLQARSCWEP